MELNMDIYYLNFNFNYIGLKKFFKKKLDFFKKICYTI